MPIMAWVNRWSPGMWIRMFLWWTSSSGRSIETRIGSKQAVITLNPAGGTTKSTRANHQEASLTPAQVLELTGLLEQVERYYQKPVDIEWAISGDKIFLLQARPITTYLPLPDEMITAPGQPKRLYCQFHPDRTGLAGTACRFWARISWATC